MMRLLGVLFSLIFVTSADAQEWKLRDSGVGLIMCDADYATQLKIVERNDAWDAKRLYESGALSGRCSGNNAFAAWIQGPHTKEYQNSNGLPVWYYKYKVTSPDGKSSEFGPYGFYTPGFATAGINPAGMNGSWKIDWYIVHRDTKELRHVGTSQFTITGDR